MANFLLQPRLNWPEIAAAADTLWSMTGSIWTDPYSVITKAFGSGSLVDYKWRNAGEPFRMAALRYNTGFVGFCTGIAGEPSARSVLDGYADRSSGSPTGPGVRNSTYDELAQQFITLMDELAGLQEPRYTLIGHSAGGCVALYVAAFLKQQNPQREVQVVTFGSPRPAGSDFAGDLAGCQVTRIMYNLDPVPYIPYGVAELLGTLNRYGSFRTQRFSWFRQVGVGLVVPESLAYYVADIPPDSATLLRSSFDAFLTGTAAGINEAHGAWRYKTITAAVAAAQNPVQAPLRENPPVEPAVDSPRARVREAQHAVTEIFRQASEERLDRTPTIPDAWRYRVIREGGVYTVVQGDNVVSMTGHLGQAKACARQGNQFVSELLRQPFVHVDGMEEGLKGLVEEAQENPAAFGLEWLGDVDDLDAV